MIKVAVSRCNGSIISLEVTGHAFDGLYGNDVVCAGVSSVVIGLLNAIDELASGSCQIDKDDRAARISITVTGDSSKTQTVLETGIIQLKTISAVYPKRIKISEEK